MRRPGPGNFVEKKMNGQKSEEPVMADALLARAQNSWNAMSQYRQDRDRCKRFTYGDQWSDIVESSGGLMSEEAEMRSHGRTPLKNNLIRRLVRNVLGVFRDRYAQPACIARDGSESPQAMTMQKLLRYNAELNRMGEIYARTMEEFLISGMCVHKKWYGRKGRLTDCWTDFVQPDKFFVDMNGRDFRGWDISLIGEIHDMTPATLLATFAGSEEKRDRLLKCYGGLADRAYDRVCRVWEIWERTYPARWHCHDRVTGRCWKVGEELYPAVRAENRRRRKEGIPEVETHWYVDDEWRWSFVTSGGMVIDSGVSPYRHGGHPYVFKAYPFVNGEIHSFVSDIIDQQKYTNRLISMYDWILKSSAKGVLLMPENALPKGVDLDAVAEEWSRFDGVIVFRPHAGEPLPQQISSKCTDIGVTELLNIQMKMMEDISGVNGALQGKLDSSSMSGTLYNQQTRNSLTALSDLMSCFDDFIRQCTAMDADNIGQFYTPDRIRRVAGIGSGLMTDRLFDCSQFDFSFE